MGCFVNLPIQQTLLGTMHSGWINVIVKHHCVRKKMTLTCGWNAYTYMCFGFYFFQIGNHTKNDCPLSIISCSFLSVGCNTKVWFLHFLNQSLFIVLIVLLVLVSEIVLFDWLLWFDQILGGRGLALGTPYCALCRETSSHPLRKTKPYHSTLRNWSCTTRPSK